MAAGIHLGYHSNLGGRNSLWRCYKPSQTQRSCTGHLWQQNWCHCLHSKRSRLKRNRIVTLGVQFLTCLLSILATDHRNNGSERYDGKKTRIWTSPNSIHVRAADGLTVTHRRQIDEFWSIRLDIIYWGEKVWCKTVDKNEIHFMPKHLSQILRSSIQLERLYTV